MASRCAPSNITYAKICFPKPNQHMYVNTKRIALPTSELLRVTKDRLYKSLFNS